jgi:hypothetical protein
MPPPGLQDVRLLIRMSRQACIFSTKLVRLSQNFSPDLFLRFVTGSTSFMDLAPDLFGGDFGFLVCYVEGISLLACSATRGGSPAERPVNLRIIIAWSYYL